MISVTCTAQASGSEINHSEHQHLVLSADTEHLEPLPGHFFETEGNSLNSTDKDRQRVRVVLFILLPLLFFSPAGDTQGQ